MKKLLFILSFCLPFTLMAQNIEKPVKLGCYPPNGTNKILNKPDTSAIHPAYLSEYKGGGFLGSSWSFVATKVIVNKQGKFYYGDIYSPRGGKLNEKQGGYNGPVYVYAKDCVCK